MRSRSILAGVLLAASLVSGVSTASAAPKVPDAAKVRSSSTDFSAASAEQFWTPERLAAAKPVPHDVPVAQLRQTAQTSMLGKLTVAGSSPKAIAAEEKLGTMAGNLGSSWPRRHDWVSMTNGKVFFENNGFWECSGVVINSAARNTVFTAGHCVHGGRGGAWARNWTFVPDYYFNDRPAGTWSARQLFSLNGWINDSNNSYDIGAAVMNTLNGRKLADVTGSQGIRLNGPSTPYVWHFGFPANPGFNGQDLINCDGQTSRPGNVKLACNMHEGASGGALLADFNQSWGYTVSVNSYHVGNDRTQIYGPYFGDGAKNLYDTVKNLA